MTRHTPAFASVNSRLVFGIYAAVACPLGLLITLGDRLVISVAPDPTFGVDALIRVAGMVIVLAGCSAIGFALVENPGDRRRALGWFAFGHALLLGMLFIQRSAIWGPGLADWVLRTVTVVTVALAYAWSTADGDPPWWRLPPIGLLRIGPGGSTHRNVSAYEEQIREVAAQEERNRLARDLHDSIKQQIFVIHTAAATVETRFSSDPDGAKQALTQIRDSAREAMTEMEAMMDRLRAAPLENAGLVDALKKQCEAVGFRTGAGVDFTLGRLPANDTLAPGAQQAIFRAAQEALANVARHARAAHVGVTLDSTADELYVTIADDGAGYDQNEARKGMGLENMRTRAEEFSGDFQITSRPGHGTTVRFGVPYAAASAREFGRRALWAGAALAIFAVFAFAYWRRGSGAGWTLAVFFVTVSLDLSRYLVAWWRTGRMKTRPA